MNAIAEIDKAGRVVIPKKLRDELHLTAGMQLKVSLDGDRLVLAAAHAPRGLYSDRGTLVYDTGQAAPTDARDSVRVDRVKRMSKLSATGDQRR